jgi:HEAT repeat protein
MWRRDGDAAYTLVTLAIFGFETLALGALSLSFLLGKWAGVTSTPIEGVLLATVVSAASALAMVGLYLLSYQFVSKLRDRRHAGQLDTWTERWIGLALADDSAESIAGSPRSRRLPRAAVHAVLSLLEAVKGEEGDRLKAVLARHGVDRWLLRHVRSGHLTARLDAIESLGKARLPQSLDSLLVLLEHPKPVVRRMAVRAAAGTVAIMPPEPGPDGPGGKFIQALKTADLKAGVVQESLLLLETKAGAVLRDLLADPDLPDSLLWVVLETVGRLGLADMAEDISRYAKDEDPELRAATFRALHRLGTVPDHLQRPLLAALNDEVDFVRIQAAHAAAFLPAEVALPALEPRLGDDSWWVRRAAAASLARLGDDGVSTVKRAAQTHPDQAAREMAVQILLEANLLDPATARLAKGVA